MMLVRGDLRDMTSSAGRCLVRLSFARRQGQNPTTGETGKLQVVAEYKRKMFCDEQFLDASIAAMKSAPSTKGHNLKIYKDLSRTASRFLALSSCFL